MRQLRDIREPRLEKVLAHVVLDRLHVVVSGGLESGKLIDGGLPELGDQGAKGARLLGVEAVGSEHLVVGEIEQPFDLHMNAGAIEPGLGEVFTEAGDGGAVAAIEWAERLFGEGIHEGTRRIPGSIWRNSAALAFSIMPSTPSNMAASE